MKFKRLLKLIRLILMSSFYGIVLQILCMSLALANTGTAQGTLSLKDIKLNMNLKEDNLVSIFSKIEKLTDLHFVYEQSSINNKIKISKKIKEKSLYDILLFLSKEGELSFQRVNDVVNVKEFKRNKEAPPIIENLTVEVSGKITDEYGQGLPGATILEKGTSNGVISDLNGNYKLIVPKDAIIVISYVGYKTQEIAIGSQSVIDISMELDFSALENVVVTALGIEREKASLGYSAQAVTSEQLSAAQAPDIASKLTGKVAGLQINTAATIGGSSRIVLRGENSLSKSGNEALIVVDGVPINTEGSVTGGVDWGNGLSDFNSNDIESINVLKGAAAAALYGSRAGNGVILITTKKGKKGKPFTVEYNTSVMFESLLEYPDTYQYEYAVGKGDNSWLYSGRGEYNPSPYDESWSTEKYDPNRYVEWWYSPTWNGFRAGDINIQNKGRVQKLPFVSSGKNNYEEFFEVGRTFYNQIAVSSSGDNTTARFSYENMDQKGMQPGTDLKRQSISTNINSELANRVKLNFALNYINTTSDNRPRQHWGANSINYVLAWMMPGARMDQLKNYW